MSYDKRQKNKKLHSKKRIKKLYPEAFDDVTFTVYRWRLPWLKRRYWAIGPGWDQDKILQYYPDAVAAMKKKTNREKFEQLVADGAVVVVTSNDASHDPWPQIYKEHPTHPVVIVVNQPFGQTGKLGSGALLHTDSEKMYSYNRTLRHVRKEAINVGDFDALEQGDLHSRRMAWRHYYGK